MNASATIRASVISTSGISMHTGHLSQLKEWPNFVSVVPNCSSDDIEVGSYVDFDLEKGRKSKLRRMFTTFPYQDAMYMVAVLYTIGGILFTINSFFLLLPLVAPSMNFSTEKSLALPITLIAGFSFFTLAGFLDLTCAPSAKYDVPKIMLAEKPEPQTHVPAYLGSRDWAAVPQSGRYAELLANCLPFQAGVIHFLGTLFLIVAAFTSYPGVLDTTKPTYATFVYGPNLIGGFFFLVANTLLLISCEQDVWWKPNLWSVGWHSSFQCTIGSLHLFLYAIFLFTDLDFACAVTTFVGSWTYMIGSFLGWYVTMEVC
ncbi:hypothetical protein K504DRAFT_539333 [Pleomassaria siparia CBS 279.74]|uniref:Integral membrane protein n=1 Tax=Pleomassaria siparia CBS 279.74 TaxID=1314801 RepID=A0A6G1JS06_9PLEO|nr:hypothetical protein K504DRAFT_539333 [Pleomassaria siparia CBS 279.74]